MTGFDTDILTELLAGTAAYVARLGAIPLPERGVPVVAAVEVFRGRLHAIRQAEAGRGHLRLEQAYSVCELSLRRLRGYDLLPYTAAADAQYAAWRAAKIRIGTQDLRIAAICHTAGATLVTRNARDFAQVPGLRFSVWP